MKAAVLILVSLFPLAAAAEDQSPLSAPTTAAVQAQSAQRPAPVPTRRRGSMVGYVDDATLETQIRVRFDVGLHDRRPDRAEFFYAKCGCYRQLAGNAAYDPTAPGPGPGLATDI